MEDFENTEPDLVQLYRNDLKRRGLSFVEIERRVLDVDDYMSDYFNFLQDENFDIIELDEDGDHISDDFPHFTSTVDGIEGYYGEYYPVYCLWTNVETFERSIASLDDFFSFLVASGNLKEVELERYRALVETHHDEWKEKISSYHGGLKGLFQAMDAEKKSKRN